MLLLIDNYDSFTYNLVDYLCQLQVEVKVFRNSETLEEVSRFNYKGVILSPGPGVPESSGNLLKILRYFAGSHPILGICLGHQAIGSMYGARIVRAGKPMHGKISKIRVEDDYLFNNMPDQLEIVRYHSLILDNLPACLKIIARTSEGEIMAIRHENLNIRGLQFHPEAFLTQYGFDMIRNWINVNFLS